MKRQLSTVIPAALVVCACAAAVGAADRLRIANEGGIGDKWMLADGIQLAGPGYPVKFAERGDNVCVAVGYAINPDGTTSDFSLLKNWNSSTGETEPAEGYWDAFAQAGAGALSQWKFKPRPEVTKPETTYTVATMQFIGKQATDAVALRSHCNIADLTSLIQENNSDKFIRGEHNKNQLERLNQTQQTNHRMVEDPRSQL